MIKHADSLNFWQALQEARQKRTVDKRNQELRPAWWTNLTSDAAGGLVPSRLISSNMYNSAKPEHYTRNANEISDIVEHSGMDLSTYHIPPKNPKSLTQNYFYQPNTTSGKLNWLQRLATGLPKEPEFGEHGALAKSGPNAEQWHIPILARELGKVQEAHSPEILPKLISRLRNPSALAGSIAGGVESLRALDNNSRPLAERKQMLNRASAISGAGMIPLLTNELRAGGKGMNLLRSLPLTNKAGILEEAARTNPKAFSTYALMAAAPVLAPQIAKLFLPKHVD
jgi:hypothetical protein